MNHRRITRFVFTTVSVLVALAMLFALVVASSQIDIPGPTGSGSFGSSVTVLPNGNLVICDPGYDAGSTVDVGAAYLYDGADGTLISTLTGSMAGDRVCDEDVTVLANGNYLLRSPYWDNGAAWDAGAVTWADGETGVSGTVSAANSLVGSSPGDQVGSIGVTELSNGNYVARSPYWDNGDLADVGAVTWGSGSTGVAGILSPANSLVGSTTNDRVGFGGISPLANGNYLVRSPNWNNGQVVNAGAITWASGRSGLTGKVGPDNSLVGSTSGDLDISCTHGEAANRDDREAGPGSLAWREAATSTTGFLNAVDEPVSSTAYDPELIAGVNTTIYIASNCWDNGPAVDAGAVTWMNASTGITGPISAANSLVGSSAGDEIGQWEIGQVGNGNYLILSPFWDNGPAQDAGAVTWVNPNNPITGPITLANSLVGSSADDRIGFETRLLSNGNYILINAYWDNGSAADAGAVTWGNSNTGVTGVVSAANSLVGSSENDSLGMWYQELAGGKYIVRSPGWDNGPAFDAGAITWADTSTGVTGAISAANSLVGTSIKDQVGVLVKLSNGNYLIKSPFWDNGAAIDAGAVTWVNGRNSITGTVSAANSLVGSTSFDQVGSFYQSSIYIFANGDYLVNTPTWDNGLWADVGAVTWGNGSTGITGTVSVSNSLVGGTPGDQIGSHGIISLVNGIYLALSPNWDNGPAVDAGAVTWVNSLSGITGTVSIANSLVGSSPGDQVGFWVNPLENGNYLVYSPYWDNGPAADAGAVTWVNGLSGITGTVSIANSLAGGTAGDQIGSHGVYQLSNGNYVVCSPKWDNGPLTDAGAVTWGDGTRGITGTVSAVNSLVGGAADDRICSDFIRSNQWLESGMVLLPNGNYVVVSPDWDDGLAANAGAITWADGTRGITGAIGAANSLVGSAPEDRVGSGGVREIGNRNYLVHSPSWDNKGIPNAGALTWVDGDARVTGPVSAANSLVGSSSGDQIGSDFEQILDSGDYVVTSLYWDNGVSQDAGAITWGSGAAGVHGAITTANSVLGTTPGGGLSMWHLYDDLNSQFIIGRPADNVVTLFRPNLAPVAQAGRPHIVARGALVRLDGSASYDPDGNLPLQFTWTQTGGPPVSLSDPHAISPTFTAPDERTSLTFNLVVTDALGSSSQPARAIVFVDPYQYFLPLTPEH